MTDNDMTERQRELRLYGPFPARVRGAAASGGAFKAEAEVEIISIREVYVRLGRRVEPGSGILILTRFSRTWDDEVRAPIVALRGTVSRVEPAQGRGYGVTVTITRCRFL